jgi:PAS domain-containing protein
LAQQPIEMILLHQWASYIATPIFVVDAEGNLIYYNEAADLVIGARFDDVGEINAADLADFFVTTDLDGDPLPNHEIPLVIALEKRIPAHRRLRFRGIDGSWREIETAAIPVEGQGNRLLGAFTAFWEVGEP